MQTQLKLNKNNNYFLLIISIILFTYFIICFFSSCSTTQTCLREKDAYKHKKQIQRDLNYQFNGR